jgi:Fe-S cluster assembly protein SufD
MNALLSSLTAENGHLDPRRRAALDAVSRAGTPGARSERWKYTSLRALERRSFAEATEVPTPDATALAHIPAPRLVFVNGFYSAALSDISDLPDGVILRPVTDDDAIERSTADIGGADAVFAQLNTAMARSGIWLHVAAEAICVVPLQLVFAGTTAASDHVWHLRHRITLSEGASATVVEHHLGIGLHRHLANHAFDLALGANATMRHARIQHDSDGATLIQDTNVTLAQRTSYRRVDLELGGGLSRHDLKVSLAGEHATLYSGGVLLANSRRHLDTRLDIRHVARNTICDLRWRALASDRSRAVFHGGIVIDSGADGSDARLSNKNLLLSTDAEIDAQPVLEIHADEVKAAHGATVGRLDETALFYLRSRGLPLADARQLLIAAFCREPMNVLVDPVLTNLLACLIDQCLATRGLDKLETGA